jgi:hypothetical protein
MNKKLTLTILCLLFLPAIAFAFETPIPTSNTPQNIPVLPSIPSLLSITGSTSIPINSVQTFTLSTIASEGPDSVYTDGTYSELYGIWLVTDQNKNITAQKTTWVKLSNTQYSDNAVVTFPSVGTFSVVSMIVKVPQTFVNGAWVKGAETVVGQDKLSVVVSLPTPTPTPPSNGILAFLLSIWNWLISLIS